MLAVASVGSLVLIELAIDFGMVTQYGTVSRYLSLVVIAFILGIGAYISLAVYGSYMARLQEQNELAETLAESEHEYRSIVENSVDPFYRADREGRIVAMSPSIERFTRLYAPRTSSASA
ncbi:MAG: PAS domain S-box protein [Gammaproteobacteria bacterium]|nr:PAS domain S-box protein [Gammaproteobacteria bacterium]